jgi:competence protein ComEA
VRDGDVYDAAPWSGRDADRSAGDGPGEPAGAAGHRAPVGVQGSDEPGSDEPGGDGLGSDSGGDAEPGPAGWVPDRRVRGARPGGAWAARLTTAGPWGELAEKWVPESLRGARVDPKRRGALLLSAVAAVAAIVAALGVWWSRPQPTPVLRASSTESSAEASAGPSSGTSGSLGADLAAGLSAGDLGTPQGAAGPDGGQAAAATPGQSEPPAATGSIVVSVTGTVRHPGLVTVPAGARVADAIAAAGGARHDADLTGLNLAARLTDGSSVVVAAGGSAVTPESVAAGDGTVGVRTTGGTMTDVKISLNTADAAALQSLAGVGPVTAAAIIAYRTEHGPFTDLAQLEDVSGIGPATFARLKPHVTL